MNEEKIYNWLYLKKDGSWGGSFNADAKLKPFCGDPDNYEWIKWNKPIPDEILQAEPGTVKYEKGEVKIL